MLLATGPRAQSVRHFLESLEGKACLAKRLHRSFSMQPICSISRLLVDDCPLSIRPYPRLRRLQFSYSIRRAHVASPAREIVSLPLVGPSSHRHAAELRSSSVASFPLRREASSPSCGGLGTSTEPRSRASISCVPLHPASVTSPCRMYAPAAKVCCRFPGGPRSRRCCRPSMRSRRSASIRPMLPQSTGSMSTIVCPSASGRDPIHGLGIKPGCTDKS